MATTKKPQADGEAPVLGTGAVGDPLEAAPALAAPGTTPVPLIDPADDDADPAAQQEGRS